MEAAMFVSSWIGTSLPISSLQVRARAKIWKHVDIVYDVESFQLGRHKSFIQRTSAIIRDCFLR